VIVYLASFPRSGNAFLRSILRANFGIGGATDFTTDVDRVSREGRAVSLPAALRQRLSEGAGRVFVKTHAFPPEGSQPGEHVVQIVRHPGAALWSYFRLVNDSPIVSRARRFRGVPPTLENVIAGKLDAGDWSNYHRSWEAAARSFGGRFLRIRYESLVADQAQIRSDLATFLSLAAVSSEPVLFRPGKRKSTWDMRGTSEGYERYYSARQLELLWDAHGGVAASLGYTPPDFSAAAPDEQVRRLSERLEQAWMNGRTLEAHPVWKWRRGLRRALARIGIARSPMIER
jgi:Sulfotransferase domain